MGISLFQGPESLDFFFFFPVVFLLAFILLVGSLIKVIKKIKAKEKLFGNGIFSRYLCLIYTIILSSLYRTRPFVL